jgi:hypothetical protein
VIDALHCLQSQVCRIHNRLRRASPEQLAGWGNAGIDAELEAITLDVLELCGQMAGIKATP